MGQLKEVGKMALKFASEKVAAHTIEKTTQSLKRAPQILEDYLEQKKDKYLSDAKTEAERFFASQLAIMELRIDQKIAEIEKKMDDRIEKELKYKLRILVYTLMAVSIMGLVSLGYLYTKKKIGL